MKEDYDDDDDDDDDDDGDMLKYVHIPSVYRIFYLPVANTSSATATKPEAEGRSETGLA